MITKFKVACSRGQEKEFSFDKHRRDPAEGLMANRQLPDADIYFVPFHTAAEVESPNLRFNNHFSLRFYLPKNAGGGKKMDRLFIFLNGFAEATSDFWDAIGNSFARAGAGSMLIPLPDHFCRNIFFNMNDYDQTDPYVLPESVVDLRLFTKIMKQELINHPGRFLEFNHQIHGDVRKVLDSLSAPHLADGPISSFITRHFEYNLRTTIMGYSLGGLCALQSYLGQADRFSSCVLLNSGASFQDMDGSSMFGQEEWIELQRGLLKVARERKERAESNYFSHVILGHAKVELHGRLAANCHKILVLLGGTDRIINYRSMANLEPHQTGLAIFQIPGLEHHINIKSIAGHEWHSWSDFAVQMILAFEENHPRDPSLPKRSESVASLEQ